MMNKVRVNTYIRYCNCCPQHVLTSDGKGQLVHNCKISGMVPVGTQPATESSLFLIPDHCPKLLKQKRL